MEWENGMECKMAVSNGLQNKRKMLYEKRNEMAYSV